MTTRFLDHHDTGVIALTDRIPATGVGSLLESIGMRKDPLLRTRWTFPDVVPRPLQHSLVDSIVSNLKELGEEVNLELDLGHPAEPEEVQLFAADPSATRVHLTQGPTATINAEHLGPDAGIARAVLVACGFRPAGDSMRLRRIDGEEEHYAAHAVTTLRKAGFTVDAEPHLDPEQDFNEADQEWVDYPMPWMTREEVIQFSAQAQTIFEDIRSGRLLVHAHAFDGDIPIAVATYVGGDTVLLHGSDHLRQEIERNSDPLPVLTEFLRHYEATARPGPAPTTMAEQLVNLDQAARIAEHTSKQPTSTPATGSRPDPSPGPRR